MDDMKAEDEKYEPWDAIDKLKETILNLIDEKKQQPPQQLPDRVTGWVYTG